MSISQNDFNLACSSLQRCGVGLTENSKWEAIEMLESYGAKYVRIQQQMDFAVPGPDKETFGSQEIEVHEEDTEILDHSRTIPHSSVVVYDIIHSPSYQVPVLYITLKHSSSSTAAARAWPPPDEVSKLLIPEIYQTQTQAVGVMGALSMTDHPITGTPAYFIHPCRTAEAMTAVTGGENVKPEEYLMKWIGIVGASVGLDVPVELVQAMSKPG